ncbi:MAG: DUF1697 domain-containing protein [bacterium]
MTRYIGLLRAVNLGGRNRVVMPGLRDLLTRLGFDDPRTILQSGNVVFGCARRRALDLESVLEAEIEKRLKVGTDCCVRSADEWGEVVARNPFPKEAKHDPGHLVVMVLKDRPTGEAMQELQAAITGSEVVRVEGRQAYVVYPDGIGRSRLTNAVIEKKLRTRGTGRNWNTILKLNALVRARGIGSPAGPRGE